MSFSSDIDKFAKKVNASADEVSRVIPIALFNGVILDTRVDTGRLRSNWQTTTNSPATNILDRKDKIPKGVMGGDAMKDVINEVKAFSVTYLTNNLPYAVVYEELDGMIAKNMTRINRNIKEAINSVRK